MDRRVCLPTWKSLHGLGTLAHSSIVAFPLHAVVQDWHGILPFMIIVISVQAVL